MNSNEFLFTPQTQLLILRSLFDYGELSSVASKFADGDSFSTPEMKTIASWYFQFIEKFGSPPTLNVALDALRNSGNLVVNVLESVKSADLVELEYARSKLLNFLKARCIQKASVEIEEARKAGKFQEAVDLMVKQGEDLASITWVQSSVKDVGENFEQRLAASQELRDAQVSTGITPLDIILDGGIGSGEYVLLAGLPKAGKSTLCMNMAVNMASKGTPIMFVSTEIDEQQFFFMVDSYLARHPLTEVRKGNWTEEAIARARAAHETLKGNLKFLYLSPSQDLKVLESSLDKLRSNGFYPKFLFVDYVDHMTLHLPYSQRFGAEVANHMYLDTLAKQRGFSVITPVQVKEESLRDLKKKRAKNDDNALLALLGVGDIAGAGSDKCRFCTILITLNGSIVDLTRGIVYVHVPLARNFESGRTQVIYADQSIKNMTTIKGPIMSLEEAVSKMSGEDSGLAPMDTVLVMRDDSKQRTIDDMLHEA